MMIHKNYLRLVIVTVRYLLNLTTLDASLQRVTGKAGNGKWEQEIQRAHMHIEVYRVLVYEYEYEQWIPTVRLLYESEFESDASCFG